MAQQLFMSHSVLQNSELSSADFQSQQNKGLQSTEFGNPPKTQELHFEAGGLLKSIVYGGLDGSTATIIIILSGIASETSSSTLLNIALSALIASAISMGLGDYLSCKAEISYIRNLKEKEMAEIQQNLDRKKKNIIEVYSAIDPATDSPLYTPQDARRVTDLFGHHKKALAGIIMLYKHKLTPPIDPEQAVKCAIATFISFLICGSVPLLFYWLSLTFFEGEFLPVVCLGVLELFSLGWAKASMIGLNRWKAGCEMLIFGMVVSSIGYGVGFLSREG